MPDKEEEKTETTRDALAAAFDEAEKAEAPTEAPAEEVKAEKPVEAKPAEQEPAQVEAKAEKPETEKIEQPPEPIAAPEHWALEHQEMFRKLDPTAQSFLMDRSKEMEAAHTKRSQEIAPFRQATEQWTPYLQQIGATPAQVFNSLMQHEYALRTGTRQQKENVLLSLARDYGVDFSQNGGQQAPTAEEDPFEIQKKIQAAVTPLQQQVQQLHGNFEQQGYSQQQATQTAAQQQIDQFKAEKGADGKPAHPYYAEVEQNMYALAQAKVATGQPVSPADLPTLYEQACWSNPSVREKMLAADRFAEQQKAQKAEQERAAKARKAGGSLAGGGAPAQTEQPKSRRAALEAAFAAAD